MSDEETIIIAEPPVAGANDGFTKRYDFAITRRGGRVFAFRYVAPEAEVRAAYDDIVGSLVAFFAYDCELTPTERRAACEQFAAGMLVERGMIIIVAAPSQSEEP